MSEQSKTVLKSYFETNDFPTQAQFGDVIDTMSVGYNPIYGGLLPQPTTPRVYNAALASGSTDVYTVPANRKAVVLEWSRSNNTGGSIDITPRVKISGSTYNIQATQSVPNGSFGSVLTLNPILLNAGESLNVNTSAVNLTTWFKVIEFSDTSLLKRIEVINTTNGDTTMYTCPASTVCEPVLGSGTLTTSGRLVVSNFTGTTRVVSLYVVPNGGSVGASNQIGSSVSIANGATQTFNPGTALTAGDFIVITSDLNTASLFVYMNIIERT